MARKQCQSLYKRRQRLFLLAHGQSVGCRSSWRLGGGEAVLVASEGHAPLVSPWSLSGCSYYFSLCGTISKITTNTMGFVVVVLWSFLSKLPGTVLVLSPETC